MWVCFCKRGCCYSTPLSTLQRSLSRPQDIWQVLCFADWWQGRLLIVDRLKPVSTNPVVPAVPPTRGRLRHHPADRPSAPARPAIPSPTTVSPPADDLPVLQRRNPQRLVRSYISSFFYSQMSGGSLVAPLLDSWNAVHSILILHMLLFLLLYTASCINTVLDKYIFS